MFNFLEFGSCSKTRINFVTLLIFIFPYFVTLAQMPEDTPVFGHNIAEMSIRNRPKDDENLYEWCSAWLNKSSEAKRPEYGNVKAFCERIIISDNDADRFQAQQYMGAIFREMKKLDTVILNIIMRLSGYNSTKKQYLLNRQYKIPIHMGMCYWSLHEGFKRFCIDPELNKYVRTYRFIFAHACQADWLTVREVLDCFEDVCKDIKLFDNVPYPPAFLFDLDDKT